MSKELVHTSTGHSAYTLILTAEGGRPFIVIIFSKELIKALMGATVAAERWQQQTVLFPLRSMTSTSSFAAFTRRCCG